MTKSKKLIFCGTIVFSLMTTLCPAEEIYIESNHASGYVDVDNDGYVEGFIENSDGKLFFIEGNLIDGAVDDGNSFYDAEPQEKDFFGQMPELEEDEDFFEQDYEIDFEEE